MLITCIMMQRKVLCLLDVSHSLTWGNSTNKHTKTPYHHGSYHVIATSHDASAPCDYTLIYFASLEQHLQPNSHSHQTPTQKSNSLNAHTTTTYSLWKTQQEKVTNASYIPTIIKIVGMCGTIHTPTTKSLTTLNNST
jgi:hypothetical protein